jgi:hypothetical protein
MFDFKTIKSVLVNINSTLSWIYKTDQTVSKTVATTVGGASLIKGTGDIVQDLVYQDRKSVV